MRALALGVLNPCQVGLTRAPLSLLPQQATDPPPTSRRWEVGIPCWTMLKVSLEPQHV